MFFNVDDMKTRNYRTNFLQEYKCKSVAFATAKV